MAEPSYLPPTRLISFQQRVEELDPNFQRLKQRPWWYEFSNGRRFIMPQNIYTYGYLPQYSPGAWGNGSYGHGSYGSPSFIGS